MREISALGSDGLRHTHSLGNTEMCRVISAKQSIDHQNRSTHELRHRVGRNRFRISDIGERPDSVAENRNGSMRYGHCDYFRVANGYALPILKGDGATFWL